MVNKVPLCAFLVLVFMVIFTNFTKKYRMISLQQSVFSKTLRADPIMENYRRQVSNAFFSYVSPVERPKREKVHYASTFAKSIGISEDTLKSEAFLELISGNKLPKDIHPIAMRYGGHQFGNWAGQLGDGRAMLLGDVEVANKRYRLQLKGAGPTPYSRSADGNAVLRSSIREHLMSEAMHHLGIPSTRSLSLVLSGEEVWRDMLYDGNAAYEKGAIVCRVSESFIRFGSFEILTANGETDNLKELADYVISSHYKEIKSTGKQKYLDFLEAVSKRTLHTVIQWQRVGFVHGVLNTDNMSIIGETIDYGPYGWQDNFDVHWTPNTTDSQHKRYRFGQQGNIALWNLLQLANALYPLIEDAPEMEAILGAFQTTFRKEMDAMLGEKIGLTLMEPSDKVIADNLLDLMQLSNIDMTIFYRSISLIKKTFSVKEIWESIQDAFYDEALRSEKESEWKTWIKAYKILLEREGKSDEERQHSMQKVNPKYVLRNYMLQEAIEAAEKGDYAVIEELYELIQNPYEEQANFNKWYSKRPDWAMHKAGCSMLSCSS